MRRISFHDQIARNKRNSVFLLIFIFLIFMILAYVISLIWAVDIFLIFILFIIISLIYIFISYYYSDKIALASIKAKKADPIEYRQLHHSVEGLSIASGMPKPQIYIIENPQINAFATGRDPKNSVVGVTTGALEKLNKSELEAVLAHEMSHIANYDIRFITLVIVMVGMVAILSQIFLRSLWFGAGNRGGSKDGKAQAIILVIGILLAILAPIAVKLVQFAVSRKREYAADAGSVKLTRYPQSMINALKKIKNNKEMKVPSASAPLFLSNPYKVTFTRGLFSTHPPIDERIRILERM